MSGLRQPRIGHAMLLALGVAASPACRALIGAEPLVLDTDDGGHAGQGVSGVSSGGRSGSAGANAPGGGGASGSHGGTDDGGNSGGKGGGGKGNIGTAGSSNAAGDSGSVNGGAAPGSGGSADAGEGGSAAAPTISHQITIGNFFPWVDAIHDGVVYSWGDHESADGILDRPELNNTSTDVPGPIAGPSGPFQAIQVSAGFQHVCVLNDTGNVYCWGQGGYWLAADSGGPRGAPVTGAAAVMSNVVELAAGYSFTCALTARSEVFCWGDHANHEPYGQLTSDFEKQRDASGVPSYAARAFKLDSLTGARHIALGDHHACVALHDGTPLCWGQNNLYQTGQATSSMCAQVASEGSKKNPCVLTPARVPNVGPVQQFALGGRHSCALEVSGKVWCWGDNHLGELGDPNAGSVSCTDDYGYGPENVRCSATPVEVTAVAGASYIAVRGETSCAVKNGEVWCWGSDADSELLGRGDQPGSAPGRVLLDKGGTLSHVVEVALSDKTGCALDDQGNLFCWGGPILGGFGTAANPVAW